MNRDTWKTIGAIVLIAAIVGLTFWYGNKQRSDQVKSDKAAQTQQQKTTASGSSSSTTSPSPAPTPSASQPSPAPQAAAPSPAPQSSSNASHPAPAPQTPAPAPQPASTPQTGADTAVIIPIAAVALAYGVKRASDRSLARAQRMI